MVKPAVSSGSRGAGRFEAGDPGAAGHLAALVADRDALVQPYVPSVAERGERSLIFFGGRFSHAVDKIPARGDYRVQEMYGGRYRRHQPTPPEMAAAERALAAAPADALLYARVDLVEGGDGPLVMELELIEPELFLGFDRGRARRVGGGDRRLTALTRVGDTRRGRSLGFAVDGCSRRRHPAAPRAQTCARGRRGRAQAQGGRGARAGPARGRAGGRGGRPRRRPSRSRRPRREPEAPAPRNPWPRRRPRSRWRSPTTSRSPTSPRRPRTHRA